MASIFKNGAWAVYLHGLSDQMIKFSAGTVKAKKLEGKKSFPPIFKPIGKKPVRRKTLSRAIALTQLRQKPRFNKSRIPLFSEPVML